MSSAIGSTPGIGPATNQPRTTGEVERQVGAGSVGATGGISTIDRAPDGQAPFGVAFVTVFAGQGLQPTRPPQLELVLAEVSTKLKTTREETELESTQANQEKIRTATQERTGKILEMEQKLKEAEEARKVGGILGKVADVLGAAGVVIAFIGAVTTTATAIVTLNPVKAATAATMWGMTAVSAFQFVDGQVQKHTGNTMLGHAMKAGGASEDQIKKAEEVQRWTLVGIQATLALAAVSTAVVSVATSFIPGAGNAVTAGSTAVTLLSVAAVGVAAMSGAQQIASGVTGGVKSVVDHKAATAQAEAADKNAEATQFDAFIETYESLIDQALAQLMGAHDLTNAMLDAAAGGLKDRGDSMMQVRFAG